MIIMSKFRKRLTKISKNLHNCLVVGQGFGYLQELTNIYQTVFVIDSQRPEIKAKNLVFRNNFDDLSHMNEISAVFVDIAATEHLNKITSLWMRCNSMVIIEGDDPIERHLSGPLYQSGWNCTSKQGTFHVWERKI